MGDGAACSVRQICDGSFRLSIDLFSLSVCFSAVRKEDAPHQTASCLRNSFPRLRSPRAQRPPLTCSSGSQRPTRSLFVVRKSTLHQYQKRGTGKTRAHLVLLRKAKVPPRKLPCPPAVPTKVLRPDLPPTSLSAPPLPHRCTHSPRYKHEPSNPPPTPP